MKKLALQYFFVLFISLYHLSCKDDTAIKINNASTPETLNTQTSTNNGVAKIIEPIEDNEIVVLEKNGITLTEVKSNNYSKASLKLITNQFKEGINTLDFAVSGIEKYTIATIENNYMVSQHNQTQLTKQFLVGNNVLLAFLTQPNNISIKTNNANVLKNITLGDEPLFDMNQPHLFYYLPKPNSTLPILDFYLVNTSLAKHGNKVKVIINNTEFILNKWAAYQVDGLNDNKNVIRIQLIDKKGNLIEGPFNDSGDRIISSAST